MTAEVYDPGSSSKHQSSMGKSVGINVADL